MTERFGVLLRESFPDASPPKASDIALSQTGEIDVDVYGGKRWTELHPMFLDPSMWALTLEALHYYLPAYMLAAITYDWFDQGPLLEELYTSETPESSWSQEFWHLKFARWDQFMKRLTSEQKHVVRLWLELLLEQSTVSINADRQSRIELMLANYWSQW
jgi:hypothetical protein